MILLECIEIKTVLIKMSEIISVTELKRELVNNKTALRK